MIVRLMGEGQYELESKYLDELNQIDNRLVELVSQEDQENFQRELQKMAAIVREKGRHLPDDIIKESDLIIPPPDITLEEAKKIFTGDGIIEG